jgi:hypothetical protein
MSSLAGQIFKLSIFSPIIKKLSYFSLKVWQFDRFIGLFIEFFPTGIVFSEGQTWQGVRRFTLRNLRDFGFGKSSIEGLIQCEIEELLNSLS